MDYKKSQALFKKRREKIGKMMESGKTWQEIAEVYKISKQRIYQIYGQYLLERE